ncbi:cartilage matrix protein-like [Physella acuta]|uniref:cartilage matrix protein-like n=1 Tax=Physella acuta TaxID=109671 RepID=UPI0027DB29AA|nr:cartilage matrix protein-like [Physella acuta]
MWKLIVSLLFFLLEQTYCADSKCADGTLVDVTFVFECSSTIGSGNWNKEAQFISDLIKQFKLGPKDARVAAVTFATNSVRLFDLRNITDPSVAETALKGNGNLNAQSYTDQVFNAIMGWNMFTNKVSGRTSAASYIVYITDGLTTFLSRSTDSIKKFGVTFISVGISNNAPATKLKDLSAPDQPFSVPNYDSLNSLRSKILDKSCPVVKAPVTTAPPTTVKAPVTTTEKRTEEVTFSPYPGLVAPSLKQQPKQPTNCKDGLTGDVYFLLDSSKTINSTNWCDLQEQVAILANSLPTGPNSYRIGAAAYSDSVSKIIDLKDSDSIGSVVKAILAAPFLDGATETGKALDFVSQSAVFDVKSGGRARARDIVVLLSDGYASLRNQARNAANQLKFQNVAIITIGIGPDVNVDSLKEIASSPSDFLITYDFRSLSTIVTDIQDRICSCKLTVNTSHIY